MKKTIFLLMAIINLLFSSVCTEIDTTTMQDFHEYLDSKLNIMTYDQALMNWGEPVSEYEGDEIFVVTWGTNDASNVIAPVGNALMSFKIEDGWSLRLSFHKKTRKLVSWKYYKW